MLTFLLVGIIFRIHSQNWPAGIHDPSNVVKDKDRYWIFGTGDGIFSMYSYDLVTWQNGPTPFTNGEFPEWILKYAKSDTDQFGGFFWAPDIIYMNNQYYLYYSASVWGTTFSCIGLVINKTLDPGDPDYKWEDQGDIGIYSPRAGWSINAIDPAVMRGPDQRIWMTYGSFNRDGILVTELDSVSGKPVGSTTSVANSWTGGSNYGEGEGGNMFYRQGYYYLVYNKGGCCNGVASSYYMVMGRSESPTGPFADEQGMPMRAIDTQSGGTVIFRHDDSRGLEDRYFGPGHFGVYREDGTDFVSFHYYSPNGYYPSEEANYLGGPTLGLATLEWEEDGWPNISMDFLPGGIYTLTNVNSSKALDLQNQSTAPGTLPYQYPVDAESKTQKWYFQPLGTGEYAIRSYADTAKYLEVTGPGYDMVVKLTENYTGAVNQKWRLVKGSDGKLIAYPSTKDNILEIPNALTQDYRVQLWPNTNHDCQRWYPTLVSGWPQRLSINHEELYFEADGTTGDVLEINSNTFWDIVVGDRSWIEVSPMSGFGDTTVTVVVSENTLLSERTSVLGIKVREGSTKFVYIRQAAGKPATMLASDFEDLKILVGPNPASDFIAIEWPQSKFENPGVQITDLGGKLLVDKVGNTSRIMRLDLSALKKGVYVLKIWDATRQDVFKLIKD